jgi:hypothetical protein
VRLAATSCARRCASWTGSSSASLEVAAPVAGRPQRPHRNPGSRVRRRRARARLRSARTGRGGGRAVPWKARTLVARIPEELLGAAARRSDRRRAELHAARPRRAGPAGPSIARSALVRACGCSAMLRRAQSAAAAGRTSALRARDSAAPPRRIEVSGAARARPGLPPGGQRSAIGATVWSTNPIPLLDQQDGSAFHDRAGTDRAERRAPLAQEPQRSYSTDALGPTPGTALHRREPRQASVRSSSWSPS